MEAVERFNILLPPIEGEQLPIWLPTEESLAQFDKAERDMKRALEKMRYITEKLYKVK